jgi:glycosidase
MQSTFTPTDWARKTNIYEVNIRQYSPEGTFRGFLKELPRLHDMGVETLWLMPITPISVKNRKGSLGSYYACSDHTSVNPEFGTLEEFTLLVSEAHTLGMKVLIDWVANHTGCDHWWIKEHPEYYRKNLHGDFYDAHGWDDVYDLNYDNPHLRLAMIEAMYFWINTCNVDGFRCDMAMLTPVDFWYEARLSLDRHKPLFWLAELDSWDNPEYMQVFDAAYTWKWLHATKDFYQTTHRRMVELDGVLMHYHSLQPKSTLRVWFTSNHDENSWNGTEYERYGKMALPLAVFSCTWEGIPLIYSGQELPNEKRLGFFDRDPIPWTGEAKLHGFYWNLLKLRSSHPAFVSGDHYAFTHRVATHADHAVFSFLRRAETREILVFLNFSDTHFAQLQVNDEKVGGPFTELFTGVHKDFTANWAVNLEPWGYQVWVK